MRSAEADGFGLRFRQIIGFTFFICCVGAAGCTRLPTAQCRITIPGITESILLGDAYPTKHSKLRYVSDDLYADIKYSPSTSRVRVTFIRMPHAPWTFGESIVSQTTVQLVLYGGKRIGHIDVSKVGPGAQLICEATVRE